MTATSTVSSPALPCDTPRRVPLPSAPEHIAASVASLGGRRGRRTPRPPRRPSPRMRDLFEVRVAASVVDPPHGISSSPRVRLMWQPCYDGRERLVAMRRGGSPCKCREFGAGADDSRIVTSGTQAPCAGPALDGGRVGRTGRSVVRMLQGRPATIPGGVGRAGYERQKSTRNSMDASTEASGRVTESTALMSSARVRSSAGASSASAVPSAMRRWRSRSEAICWRRGFLILDALGLFVKPGPAVPLRMRHADAALCFPAHRSFCGCKHQRVCYRDVLDILFELQRLHLRVRKIDIQLKARHEACPGRVHEHDRPCHLE